MLEKVVRMFIVRKETMEMIEHEGKFYSPEDLAEKLKVAGEIEIKVNEESWFSQALENLTEEDK